MPLEAFADVMQQLAGRGRRPYKKEENMTSKLYKLKSSCLFVAIVERENTSTPTKDDAIDVIVSSKVAGPQSNQCTVKRTVVLITLPIPPCLFKAQVTHTIQFCTQTIQGPNIKQRAGGLATQCSRLRT